MTVPRWSEAMRRALYGPGGFYTRNSPHRHFRTSAQFPLFAAALAELVRRTDSALAHPEVFTLVDVGAGSGELLRRLLEQEDLDGRLRAVAVELRPAPEDLHPGIDWRADVPEQITGLLLACEYLDNVPLDLAVVDAEGVVRYELVDPATGATAPGELVDAADAAWLRRWWPLPDPAETAPARAEIGRPRDAEWERLCGNVSRGTALAIDYGHTRDARPPHGTVTGFLEGRQIEPVCDGSRDVTAHVAMDSLGPGRLLTQREALRDLGFSGARPPLELSRTDPVGYVRALGLASNAAELTEPSGFGGHWWLSRTIG